MHLLFLTDNFPPEVNAPASRTYEHCREWVREGHQVTVITCAPNFPKGKLYPGYKNKIWQREELDGIGVIRVWSYITANEGFGKRILDYASFMTSAFIASLFLKKCDVVIGTSPQFFTVVAAFAASRLKRIPFVFELRDLWPETIKAVGAIRNPFIISLLEKVELFLYHKAARIVSVTESFKYILIERGIDPRRIEVVTNGLDTSRFTPMAKDAQLAAIHNLNGKYVAGYIGTMGLCHSLEVILDAAAQIQEGSNHNYHFVFLGDGARKQALIKKAKDLQLKNISFIDSVGKDDVPRYWSLLDVSIIHLKNDPLFTTVIPSKLFECMGMGIPTIHGVKGESADIVQREGVGICFEPDDAGELVKALARLREDESLYRKMRESCIKAALKYDRSALARKMLDILLRIKNG